MPITLRSGKELKGSRETEKKQIDEKLKIKIRIHHVVRKSKAEIGSQMRMNS